MFCPRVTMPRPQPQPSEPDIDTNIASAEMAPDDGISGQQQKQSSRPKVRKDCSTSLHLSMPEMIWFCRPD